MARHASTDGMPAAAKDVGHRAFSPRAVSRCSALSSILAAMCVLGGGAAAAADITADVIVYAAGSLPESGDPFITYRVRVTVPWGDVWTLASGPTVEEPWAAIEGATFYQHPANDGNPPSPPLFAEYPDSLFTSFYTTHRGYPQTADVGVAPGFAYGPADTTNTLVAVWFCIPDGNDYPGTHVIAQFTVLPVSPEWSGFIDMEIFSRESTSGTMFETTIQWTDFADCNQNGVPDTEDIAGGISDDCNANAIPDECEMDCNGNGVQDSCDVASGASEDCNGNTIPDECEPGGAEDCNENGASDLCDVYMGTSEDCNNNAIPDECEPDCNANDVADECDIANGTSDDCNENGVPDECEPDCNSNGVEDSCDIVNGTSEDCNGNGIPDECDVGDGTSRDFNGNGIPDECECLGDLNNDNVVNLIDLAVLLDHYGTTDDVGDLDGDGDVDIADLAELLGHYGQRCY